MQTPFRCFNSSLAVIRLGVMTHIRYPLSLRQVDDILFERSIDIYHAMMGPQGSAEVSVRDNWPRSTIIDYLLSNGAARQIAA